MGRGCSLRAASPGGENSFPDPLHWARRMLIGSGDYRSELQGRSQTWFNCGPGGASQAQLGTYSLEPLQCGRSVLLASGGRLLSLQLGEGGKGGRSRLPSGPRLLRQVEISAFKLERANQGLARRPVQTRGAAGLPPRARGSLGRGAGEPAASVTGEQHRRLGLPAPWSAPCTESPYEAGTATRTCPSISPPLVSAHSSRLPGAASFCSQLPGRTAPMGIGEAGSRRSFCSGPPSLAPSSCGGH